MSGAERSVILCTAGYDHTIRFWEAPTGMCHRTLQYADSVSPQHHTAEPHTAAAQPALVQPGGLSPSRSMVAVRCCSFCSRKQQVNRLEITPDKQYLAVAGNPHIRLFDIHSTRPDHMGQFDGHTNNVTAIGFQKDRKWMYSSSEDASIKVWDIRVPQHQRDYQSKAAISCVVLHPNQGELISGDEEGVIRVWDLTANACVMEWVPEGRCAIRSLTVGSDASVLVAVNNRGMVYSWKLNTQHSHTAVAPPAQQPNAHSTSLKDNIHSTPTHPTSTSSTATPAKPGSLEPIIKYEAHPASYITKCLLSPDVKLLATAASDRSIRIWNCEHGYTCERTLQGHSAWVWDVSFSADSAYLVSGSSDKTAKLWDVKSGEIILEYKGHSKAITAVALNDSS